MDPEADILDVLVAAGRREEPKDLDAYQASLRAAVAERVSGPKPTVGRYWKPLGLSVIALAILAGDPAHTPVGVTTADTSALTADLPSAPSFAAVDAGASDIEAATTVPQVEVSALPNVVSTHKDVAVKEAVTTNDSRAKETAAKEVATAPSAPAATTMAAVDTLAEEIALVEAARVALKGSPETALATVGEFYRKYPVSRVRDEADVVRIEALARLGHAADAENAAREFLSTRPQSPYASRVQKALSGMRATP